MIKRHLSLAGRHLLFWSLISLAILISVVRVLLADAANYKQELETKILQNSGLGIHIGKLAPHIRGFSPGVVLHNISIESPNQQKPPLALREVRIGVDLLKLILSRDLLASSRVSLVGLEAEVLRTPEDKIILLGIPSSDDPPDWLLQGNQFEILQSRISWSDQKLQKPRIQLNNVNFLLKNHFFSKKHEIHVLSDLPEHYGDKLRLSASMSGNPFQPASLDGEIYIEATNLQGPALVESLTPLNVKLASGSGDLRIWSQWKQAKPYKVDAYLQAQQIQILNEKDKTLRLDTVDGNLSWYQNDESQWRLAAYNIGVFANHQRWSDAEFYLSQNNNGDWSGLIKQFDLNALAYISPWLLDKENPETDWSNLKLQGTLKDLSIFASHDGQRYAVKGDFEQIGNSDQSLLPGFNGLSGHISGNQTQGQIVFDTYNAEVNALQYVRDTLSISRLGARINWLQTQDQWQIYSDDLHLNTPDFKSLTVFDLSIPKNANSPVLRLNTTLNSFNDIAKIKRYLPSKLMGQDAVAWLDDAFIAGHIDEGHVFIDGKLDQFPFKHGGGVFDTLLGIKEGEIQFNEAWPHLQNLYTTVHFVNSDLQVAIYDGHSEDVQINQAIINIEDVANSDHVQVFAKLNAQVNNALQYLQKTPLHKNAENLLSIANSDGAAGIDLNLHVPYVESDPVKVKVDAHLHDAHMNLKSINLDISNINGTLSFTEDSTTSDTLHAKALGYPIQGLMSSDASSTRLLVTGSTTINNLQKQFSFLRGDAIKGQLNYQADLRIPDDEHTSTSLDIGSNLQGTVIDSDTFVAKTAEQTEQLHLNFQFDKQNHLPIKLQYGNQLEAALLFDRQQDRLHSTHLVIGGNSASISPQAGMKVEIKLPSFKLGEVVSAFGSSDGRWPALREFLLDTRQLIWQDQDLGAIQCHFHHLNQAWQGSVDSHMAKGRIRIPDQRNGIEPIKLEMASLNLSAMDKLNFDAANDVITVMPLIEIESQQLLWRDLNLGSLRLQTDRLINGIHFKKIKINGAGKTIDMTADWTQQLTGTATVLNGSMSVDNFGAFLSQIKISDDFKETHADINFHGGWNGAPHQFAVEALNGSMNVRLRDGRISSIEPGFGRLLGLLAMEQWVKRLSLNFSDIYRQGLAFDQISGNFNIKHGLAATDDLLVNGVSAKMKLIGNADLVNKTINMKVGVVPKSSDAVPIAGTILNGIAAVITDAVTNNYEEGYFFGSAYSISGKWGDLDVSPIHDKDGLLNKTWNGLTDFEWLQ